MSKIIQQLEQEQLRTDIPAFAQGDTVRVQVRVKKVAKSVCRLSKASLLPSVTAVCTLLSPFARSPTAKVLSVYSRLTLR